VSGLTFEEWDHTENVDSSQMPVVMIINSSKLRVAGFTRQSFLGFGLLCHHITLQVKQERIQVVHSNRVAQKCPARGHQSVFPQSFSEAAAHRKCTRGAGILQLEGMGPKQVML